MMTTMCTIIAKNYVAYARTLALSFLEHHPAGKVYVLLADESDGYLNAREEPFEWVRLSEIGLPAQPDMRFQYDVTEFSTAVKPYFLEYLLVKREVGSVVYFDPDVLILQRMDDFYRKLPEYGIAMTPHILTPLPDDGATPAETDILRTGVYNLGFLALTRTDETLRMLRWWKKRLLKGCVMDPDRGYHVDQKWMDLVPALFDGVQIVKDEKLNVAYWNLHERRIVPRNGLYEIGGEPAAFFHFSGLTIDLSRISKHQTRHQWYDFPGLIGLFREYLSRLNKNGHAQTAGWRYAYGFFDNGIAIPRIARRIYLKHPSPEKFGNPFHTLTPNGFYSWLFSPTDRDAPLPLLLKEIYNERVDLQRLFPTLHGQDRQRLMTWARQFVPLEYGVDPVVWSPVIDSMIYR